ncbi:SIS domain-containing protein [Maribacter sp. X9]|uniref:SIS domain-containing protein n=1 Tax=Maribacter sp. X9 TaxID=3402159 RepID=UPI003AF33C5D
MKYLDIEISQLKAIGGFDTAKEISGQPELWGKIVDKLEREREVIASFLDSTLKKTEKIILTGAGTSAYIGLSVEGFIQRNTGITTLSIATTHIVSHPEDYLEPGVPTLLISFARSGNSPESIAAAKLADAHVKDCSHLIITCNADGDLAKYASENDCLVFLLPPESNDKSLAMTGSYSGMLLTILLMGRLDRLTSLREVVRTLRACAEELLNKKLDQVKKIAESGFTRAVFLGSGPLYGTAMESQLKLQELTDGHVICKNDSYLGFRHGPKAVVNEETLLVYFFSNNKKVLQYEMDLVRGMRIGKKPLKQIGVAMSHLDTPSVDELIVLDGGAKVIEDEYLSVCYIVLGQMLAFYTSLNLKLRPDSPSETGAISRVVKGVKIY